MVGAVRDRRHHRHRPQLRDGPALAELHRDVRRRVRPRVRHRGVLVLHRRRSSSASTSTAGTGSRRALHLPSGIPIAIAGLTGSLMVISVNAWMNHPGGFRLRDGPRGRRPSRAKALFANGYLWHELIHMYFAAYMVTGFVVAGAYAVARLRGAGRGYERTAMAVPLTIAALAAPVQVLVGDWAARAVAQASRSSSPRIEGLGQDDRRARRCTCSAGTATATCGTASALPKLLSLLAVHDPGAAVHGARRRRPATSAAGQRRARRVPDDGGHRDAAGRARRVISLVVRVRHRRLPDVGGVLRARWRPPARCPCVALIAGWVTTEVGRQPWVVYGVMRTARAVTRRRRHPGRLRRAVGRLPRRSASGRLDPAPPGARARWTCCRRRRRPRCSGQEPERMTSPTSRCSFVLVGLTPLHRARRAPTSAPAIWQVTRRHTPGGPSACATSRTTRMAPVWEANHVWLIFVLTVTWTAYPAAFGVDRSTLLDRALPGGARRSSSAARPTRCRAGTPGPREVARRRRRLRRRRRSLTPFALGACLGGIASGRVPYGNAQGAALELAQPDLGPHRRAGGRDLGLSRRRRTCPPTPRAAGARPGRAASAAARSAPARSPACSPSPGSSSCIRRPSALSRPRLRRGPAGADLLGPRGRGDAGAGAARRFELARYAAALAVTAIVAGWALAQQPQFLPGLTIDQAAAPHDTLVAIVAVVGGGTVLFPSLLLLLRLSLGGRWAMTPPTAAPLLRPAPVAPATPRRYQAIRHAPGASPRPAYLAASGCSPLPRPVGRTPSAWSCCSRRSLPAWPRRPRPCFRTSLARTARLNPHHNEQKRTHEDRGQRWKRAQRGQARDSQSHATPRGPGSLVPATRDRTREVPGRERARAGAGLRHDDHRADQTAADSPPDPAVERSRP